MNSALPMILAFCIGIIAGLRSLTAPAVVALATRWRWLDLEHSVLGLLGSAPAALVLVLLALGELVMDKLPTTPSRTKLAPFIGRILTGALSGAAVGAGSGGSGPLCGVLGAAGGVFGTFGGYEIRTRSVKALRVPDVVIALFEDAVAVSVAFFLVSRS